MLLATKTRDPQTSLGEGLAEPLTRAKGAFDPLTAKDLYPTIETNLM